MTVSSAMTVRMTYWLWLQGLELKLRHLTLTATWPHAWPLTHSFGWFLLTTLTDRIVHGSTKRAWESETSAATTTSTSTTNGRTKTTLAVVAHGSISAPVTTSTKSTISSKAAISAKAASESKMALSC